MRRSALRSSLLVLLGFALFFAFLGVQNRMGNFHTVLPNELYRSAQLEEGDVVAYQQKYGIKAIINLRGENTDREWYNTELWEANAAGVAHIDFAMDSNNELTIEEARALIDLMRDAPKPLLIHCHSGADRTGLASALYVAHIAKKSRSVATHQLSVIYGHIPLFVGGTMAMNRSFERIERELKPGGA